MYILASCAQGLTSRASTMPQMGELPWPTKQWGVAAMRGSGGHGVAAQPVPHHEGRGAAERHLPAGAALLRPPCHGCGAPRLVSHLQPAGAVTWTCCRGIADGRADCLIAGNGHSAVLPQLRPACVDTAVPRPLAGSALAAPVTGRAAVGPACRLGVLVQHTS